MLRGWYNRITISLYGFFTDVNQRPQEPRPEPRVERPVVKVEPKHPERDSERMDQASEKAPSERVPERAERAHERPLRRERSAERGPFGSGISERGLSERPSERLSDSRDKYEDHLSGRDDRRNIGEKERTPMKSPPVTRSPSRSPTTVTATVGESTAAKPTTPPGSPREEVRMIILSCFNQQQIHVALLSFVHITPSSFFAVTKTIPVKASVLT